MLMIPKYSFISESAYQIQTVEPNCHVSAWDEPSSVLACLPCVLVYKWMHWYHWVIADFKALRVLTADSQYASSSEILVDCPSEGGEVY